VLKTEIEGIDLDQLPLRQALSAGNYLVDEKPTVIINALDEREGAILARVGLFFGCVNAGSCCADDPTPVEPHREYCVIQLEIARDTGETTARLVDD
jgi:hypothetical protein